MPPPPAEQRDEIAASHVAIAQRFRAAEVVLLAGLGIKRIMRPIPEGRHPGQPVSPALRSARSGRCYHAHALPPQIPDPFFRDAENLGPFWRHHR